MCLEHTVLDGTSIIAELDDCERSRVLAFPPLRPLYNVILQELYREMMPSSSPLESKLTVRLASANGNSARWSACGGLTRTCTCQQACSPPAFGPHHILAHVLPMFSKSLSFPLISSRCPGPELTPFPLPEKLAAPAPPQDICMWGPNSNLSLSLCKAFFWIPYENDPSVRKTLSYVCLYALHLPPCLARGRSLLNPQ